MSPSLYYRHVYPSLRLSLLYEGLVLSLETWKLETWPESWRNRTDTYRSRVQELTKIKMLDTEDLHFDYQPPSSVRGEHSTTYYWHIMAPFLRYVADQSLRILVSEEYFDDYVRIGGHVGKEVVDTLKRSRLEWSILNHILDRYIPAFGPPDERIPKRIGKFVDAFRNGIRALASETQLYEATPELASRIDAQISRRIMRLDRLLSTERLGRIAPGTRDLAREAISFAVGEVIPLSGPLISAMERALAARTVRRENLSFVIGLSVLRRLLTNPPPEEPECPVCQLTIPEIEQMPTSSITDHFQNLCTQHTVAFLNCRKFHGLIGRPLLLCVKMATGG